MKDACGAQPGGGQTPSVATTCIPCTSAAFAELSAEILRAGSTLRFQARGWSMSPLVRNGDVLWVRPADPSSLRVGDVVLCTGGDSPLGRVIVHRVIRRVEGPDGPRFAVQGDQVARPDGLIPAERIHGRVVTIERGGAQLDMEHPLMKMLSGLAALRSRWRLTRRPQLRLGRVLFERLPILSRYLT